MKLSKKSQEALSIIEILIAVALMSVILTALAVNMAYTQRSINNAQMRAKATDYVGSCMQRFRNLRDSNSWPNFCEAIDGELTSLSVTACGEVEIKENVGGVEKTIGNRKLEVTKCRNDEAEVRVTVNYEDLSGIKKTITQVQKFKRAAHEADFK